MFNKQLTKQVSKLEAEVRELNQKINLILRHNNLYITTQPQRMEIGELKPLAVIGGGGGGRISDPIKHNKQSQKYWTKNEEIRRKI